MFSPASSRFFVKFQRRSRRAKTSRRLQRSRPNSVQGPSTLRGHHPAAKSMTIARLHNYKLVREIIVFFSTIPDVCKKKKKKKWEKPRDDFFLPVCWNCRQKFGGGGGGGGGGSGLLSEQKLLRYWSLLVLISVLTWFYGHYRTTTTTKIKDVFDC